MFNQKISISFSRYNDANFEQKGQHILSSMKDNPDFTDPSPNMVVYQEAVDTYSNALTAAATLDRVAVAEKNEARLALETLSTQLGSYVMNRSNGNVRMLTSSGFTLTKKPEPRKLAEMGPVALSNTGNSGEMKVTATNLAAANGYVYEFTDTVPAEATRWTSVATSTSKYTFKGLTPGKKYWIRVIATGARQQVQYSPVASQFAQ
jgi:hypothetical protein